MNTTDSDGLLLIRLMIWVVLTWILSSGVSCASVKVVSVLSCPLRGLLLCATSMVPSSPCCKSLHMFVIYLCVGRFRLARVCFLPFLQISTNTSLKPSWYANSKHEKPLNCDKRFILLSTGQHEWAIIFQFWSAQIERCPILREHFLDFCVGDLLRF